MWMSACEYRRKNKKLRKRLLYGDERFTEKLRENFYFFKIIQN